MHTKAISKTGREKKRHVIHKKYKSMIHNIKIVRLILKQLRKSTVAKPLPAHCAQFAHKVIHSFCGQVKTSLWSMGLGIFPDGRLQDSHASH
jgi:hypothetical protein